MPTLAHGGDRCRIHLDPRLRTTRPCNRAIAGEVLEPAECHLRATGVVHAQEEDGREAVVRLAFHASERAQALAREPLRHDRKEVRRRGAVANWS